MTDALTDPKPRGPKTPDARNRQRAGQHKGLLHAVQKRKADNSANYATNFDHGQTAVDFERSAEAAGESREEVRAHLSLLDRTLLTLCGYFPRIGQTVPEVKDLPPLPLRSDAASPRAPKLVRALALLLWRPLRLYRRQEHWEQLALFYRLQQLARWRQKHGELTVERFETCREYLQALLDNWEYGVQRRLKRIEARFWKVWRLYRGLVGVIAMVLSVRDLVGVGDSGFSVRDSGPGIPDSRSEARDSAAGGRDDSSMANSRLQITDSRPSILNLRSEIPSSESSISNPKSEIPSSESSISNLKSEIPNFDSRAPNPESRASSPDEMPIVPRRSAIDNFHSRPLLQFRGKPHYEQFHPAWHQRIDELTPEAIANPFQSPSHSLKAQQRSSQPAAVKGPEHWQQHPPQPRLPGMEFPELPASDVLREPSEGELRRMVRKGELVVPGSFEDFEELVQAALGTRSSESLGEERESGREARAPSGPGSRESSPESRAYLHALAESLWNRIHVFSDQVAALRDLLEATLVWVPNRFLRLWLKMLPVEQAFAAVDFFQHTHGPDHADMAWGEDELSNSRGRTKPRPYIVPRSEAEGRHKHAGELQTALRLWFHALWHALGPAIRGSHKVTVALYDWAVSRFGIREEFLQWRPNLSPAQRHTRHDRPEWAVRVVTVTGKTLVKLSDTRIFEPEK